MTERDELARLTRERDQALEDAAYQRSQCRLADRLLDRRDGELDHARFMAAGWRRLATLRSDREER